MKILRLVLNISLLAACFYVGYLLFKTIEEPIVFEQQKELRDDAAIAKLKKIRTAQLIFKSLYEKYAGDFDTLITVINNDSIDVVKQIGDPNDTTIVVQTEITKRAIIDSLFKGNQAEANSLAEVPNTNGEKFNIQAQFIVKNEVPLPAFQVSVPYEILYDGLVRKYYAEQVGELMRVGSIREGTTTGNWEK